ncbi:fimbrial protein [Providencia sp. Je.9.19]|uniref:fimbrial protein n=1 Tax=Providencia sp. Je.9.19 TaxID=3142844 RepID=UPI003DA80461
MKQQIVGSEQLKKKGESVHNILAWRRIYKSILLSGVLIMTPWWSYGSLSQVTVKVTVVSSPCSINNNQPLLVEFGDVLITRVDGVNYRKPIPYTLNCPADKLNNNMLKLQIQGTGITVLGPTLVLEVPNVPNFGIQLQRDNTPLAPNTWVNFTYNSPADAPKLYAVPVMKPNTTLNVGAFRASSTMRVEYQ